MNKQRLCAAVFKSRIFIDANDDAKSEISQIEGSDEESLVFVDYNGTETIQTGALTMQCQIHHCFFYSTISLYISIIRINATGTSFFTYYQSSNEAPVKVLGLAEPNAGLLTNNVRQMEDLMYRQLRDNASKRK